MVLVLEFLLLFLLSMRGENAVGLGEVYLSESVRKKMREKGEGRESGEEDLPLRVF